MENLKNVPGSREEYHAQKTREVLEKVQNKNNLVPLDAWDARDHPETAAIIEKTQQSVGTRLSEKSAGTAGPSEAYGQEAADRKLREVYAKYSPATHTHRLPPSLNTSLDLTAATNLGREESREGRLKKFWRRLWAKL